MTLISVLRVMDKDDMVEVVDDNAPIDKFLLFQGSVKECKKKGFFKNGIVKSLCAFKDLMLISVDIEYQKKKGGEG